MTLLRAYHYTIGDHLPAIVADGALKPTAAYIDKGESPILWFTLNPQWEQTAAVARMVNGRCVFLTFEEHAERLLIRFAYPACKLVPWPKIGRQARMPASAAQGLEAAARNVGARPSDWMGTLKPLRLRELQCEVWDGGWHATSAQAAEELVPMPGNRRGRGVVVLGSAFAPCGGAGDE